MTEEEARAWIAERFDVSRGTLLARLVALVRAEADRQNLIAPSTIEAMWSRHIVDSAQLLVLAGERPGAWLDIGTGAGFPGLVIACLRDGPITFCEPRRKRAEFLQHAAAELGLNAVTVVAAKVQACTGRYHTISARAVAALPELLDAARHVSSPETIWLLPKGRSAREEVAQARKTWHGSFHVEQSITQPDSLIVVAKGVTPR
ncbi:MAG: 16S rRNA (guanine(527)-N(7))-methyltransferase RsmG [Sphingomonas sp.]